MERCNDARLAQKTWGVHRAKLVARRLQVMDASPTLAIYMTTTGHPHQLHGNRRHDFTVDLDGPYRLVFKPEENPLPLDPKTNSLLLDQITSVCIQGVEDTHE